jgi:hypothetical protein
MRKHIFAAAFTIALDTTSAWAVGRTSGGVEEPDAVASISQNSFGASVSKSDGAMLVAESGGSAGTSAGTGGSTGGASTSGSTSGTSAGTGGSTGGASTSGSTSGASTSGSTSGTSTGTGGSTSGASTSGSTSGTSTSGTSASGSTSGTSAGTGGSTGGASTSGSTSGASAGTGGSSVDASAGTGQDGSKTETGNVDAAKTDTSAGTSKGTAGKAGTKKSSKGKSSKAKSGTAAVAAKTRGVQIQPKVVIKSQPRVLSVTAVRAQPTLPRALRLESGRDWISSVTVLQTKPAIPAPIVQACGGAIASAAYPLGAVHIRVTGSGSMRGLGGGSASAPVIVRIEYGSMEGRTDVREAQIHCEVDSKGRVLRLQ